MNKHKEFFFLKFLPCKGREPVTVCTDTLILHIFPLYRFAFISGTLICTVALMLNDIVFIIYFLFTGLPLFLGLLFAIAAVITKDYSYAFTIFLLTWFAITVYGLISLFLVYISSLFWSLCVFYTCARGSLTLSPTALGPIGPRVFKGIQLKA